MIDKVKTLLKNWKVHIAVAGGVVVITTAYGTCNYELPGSAELDESAETELVTPTEIEVAQ